VNEQTAVSQSALYTSARVTYANSADGFLGWHKAIDDNPESALALAPSGNQAGLAISIKDSPKLTRISALTDGAAKGKLEFYIVAKAPSDTAATTEANAPIRVSNPAPAPITTSPASLENMSPTTTLVFDGSSPRGSTEIPPVAAGAMLVRWVPENGTSGILIRELNAFSDTPLSQYAVELKPEAVCRVDGRRFQGRQVARASERASASGTRC
jgi:hypothetical protein